MLLKIKEKRKRGKQFFNRKDPLSLRKIDLGLEMCNQRNNAEENPNKQKQFQNTIMLEKRESFYSINLHQA